MGNMPLAVQLQFSDITNQELEQFLQKRIRDYRQFCESSDIELVRERLDCCGKLNQDIVGLPHKYIYEMTWAKRTQHIVGALDSCFRAWRMYEEGKGSWAFIYRHQLVEAIVCLTPSNFVLRYLLHRRNVMGVCVGCGAENVRLVEHHWWLRGESQVETTKHTKMICETCNQFLPSMNGMHILPSWEKQLTKLKMCYAEQKRLEADAEIKCPHCGYEWVPPDEGLGVASEKY